MVTVAQARAAIVAQIVDGSPSSITPGKLRTLLTDMLDALDANVPFSKIDAIIPPTANDDAANTSGNGVFAVKSFWIDIAADEAYRCVDSTPTAAVWVLTTLSTDDLGALALLNTVDTAQIDNDAVTADKLADTAVTAASYTAADITVDAQGRITAAANGTIDVADLANGTDGELITWDAAGAPAVVPVGTAAQVLTSNGAGAAPTFQDAAGGLSAWTRKTSAYTAVSGDRLLADTVATAAFTITLPASPSAGAEVTIVPSSAYETNNLTIGRNSQTIMGDAANLTIDVTVAVHLVYDGTDSDWRVS